MFVFHPRCKMFKNIIDEKLFGNVKFFSAAFTISMSGEGNIRLDNFLGGGALNDLGAYIVRSLSGLLPNRSDLKANYKISSSPNIDSAGSMIASNSTDIVFNGLWGFCLKYMNRIAMYTNAFSILGRAAFSKPTSLSPNIEIFNRHCHHNTIDSPKVDPFETPLTSFTHEIEAQSPSGTIDIVMQAQ